MSSGGSSGSRAPGRVGARASADRPSYPRTSLPMRDPLRDSWWLKLIRAQQHLEELERQIRAYANHNPHWTERRNQTKRDRNIWCYVLRMPKEASPEIGLVLGDVVHNLRAALDHLAVAIVPTDAKSSAGFPS